MTVLLRDFPLSQSFIEEGRNEGVEALLAVARLRHGELSEKLVGSLASSSRGLKELTEMVFNASNQAELEHQLET